MQYSLVKVSCVPPLLEMTPPLFRGTPWYKLLLQCLYLNMHVYLITDLSSTTFTAESMDELYLYPQDTAQSLAHGNTSLGGALTAGALLQHLLDNTVSNPPDPNCDVASDSTIQYC